MRHKTLSLATELCALIRSSLLSDISGSIGGTTYSRARGGAYARNRSVPINPRTETQEANRDLFTSTSTAWSSLTASQIQAWNTAAHAYPRTNRLGETYYPSGRQFFMELNRNLALVGAGLSTEPPPPDALPSTPATPPSIEALTNDGVLDALNGNVSIGSGADAGNIVAVFKMSPPMAAARGQSYRNLMRGPYFGPSVANMQLDAGTAGSLLTPYARRYEDSGTGGVPADVGQVINYAYRYIDNTTGLSTEWIYANQEIVSVP